MAICAYGHLLVTDHGKCGESGCECYAGDTHVADLSASRTCPSGHPAEENPSVPPVRFWYCSVRACQYFCPNADHMDLLRSAAQEMQKT